MRTTHRFALAVALCAQAAHAADGLVRVRGAQDVETSADPLENALEYKGVAVFDRIDKALAGFAPAAMTE